MGRTSTICIAVALALWPGVSWAAPLGGPVTFEPAEGTVLQVQGRGSYRGDVEVRRVGGGLTVVNVVDLESYVMGIAEVPPSWPMEALKAQAVAARTYALWEAQNGGWASRGFDICGTEACQVYTGVLSERRRQGDRWVRAVLETAGEVLLDRDDPILARYHASSGGRTLDNETVYPSSGSRRYLKGVDDEPDSVSPLHRWSVEFAHEEMSEILRAAFSLAGVLEEIDADPDRRRLTIRTQGGELEMNIVRFRREVSDTAHKMFPARFPSERPDGRLLPITLPSSRFTVTRTSEGFRVDGRGYGHGVGMSQWGAKGRAEDGDDYREILAVYYGGLEPKAWTGRETLRVGIATGAGEVKVFGDGAFGVRDGSSSLAASTLGTWRMSPGSTRTLQLDPPEGHELPLVLSGLDVPEVVELEGDRPGELKVRFVVPKAAQVEAVLTRENEDAPLARRQATFEAGPGVLVFGLDPADMPRQAAYRVDVVAFDGEETVNASAGLDITRPGSRAPLMVVLAAGALAAAAVMARRRRSEADEDREVAEPVGPRQALPHS